MTGPLAPRPDNAYDPETGKSKYGTGDAAKDIPNFGYDLNEATVSQFFNPWSGGTGGLIGAFDKVVKSLFNLAVTIAGQLVTGGLKAILDFIGNLLGVHQERIIKHDKDINDHSQKIGELVEITTEVVDTVKGQFRPVYTSGYLLLKPTTTEIDVIMIGGGGAGGAGMSGTTSWIIFSSPGAGGGGGGGGGEIHETFKVVDVFPDSPPNKYIQFEIGKNGDASQNNGSNGGGGGDTIMYASDAPTGGKRTEIYRCGGGTGGGGGGDKNSATKALGGPGVVPGGAGGAYIKIPGRKGGSYATPGSRQVSVQCPASPNASTKWATVQVNADTTVPEIPDYIINEHGEHSVSGQTLNNGGGGGGAGANEGKGERAGSGGHGGMYRGGTSADRTGASAKATVPAGGGGGAGGTHQVKAGDGGDPGGGGGGGGHSGDGYTLGGKGGVGRAWIRERPIIK